MDYNRAVDICVIYIIRCGFYYIKEGNVNCTLHKQGDQCT